MEGWWAAMGLMMLFLLLLLRLLVGWLRFYVKKMIQNYSNNMEDYHDNIKKKKSSSRVPKGSSGWPFIGETLEFIASSYTSKPVTFMHKRKAM